MTDAPDWADELAKAICRQIPGGPDPDAWEYLAPELRKIKADGLREAAEIVNRRPITFEEARLEATLIFDAILAAADKLEKGDGG